jgi:D-alanine-D-alanine ligase
MMNRPRIGLLSGGISNERYLSLRSRANILRELTPNSKYEIFPIDWVARKKWLQYDRSDYEKIVGEYSSLAELLEKCKPDCLFNAFHGEDEIDGRLAGFLDMIGIPYIGNGFYTCFAGMDKIISKMIFEREGIPTPPWFTIEKSSVESFCKISMHLPLPFPLIMKPKASGSSIGIKLANDSDEFIAALTSMEDSYFPVLVESFLHGKECNVGVAGPFLNTEMMVTPITEVVYAGAFFDEIIKKNGEYKTKLINLSEILTKDIIATTKKIHSVFQATALTRSDFIVDVEQGTFTVLEINTHPGLSSCSIFPAQLKESGISFGGLLERMIDEKLGG